MSKQPFQAIKNTPAPAAPAPTQMTREQMVSERHKGVMRQQIANLTEALGLAQANNQQLHAENQALGQELQRVNAEHEKLKGKK